MMGGVTTLNPVVADSDPERPAGVPSSPKRARTLAIAGGAGLVAGCALVLVRNLAPAGSRWDGGAYADSRVEQRGVGGGSATRNAGGSSLRLPSSWPRCPRRPRRPKARSLHPASRTPPQRRRWRPRGPPRAHPLFVLSSPRRSPTARRPFSTICRETKSSRRNAYEKRTCRPRSRAHRGCRPGGGDVPCRKESSGAGRRDERRMRQRRYPGSVPSTRGQALGCAGRAPYLRVGELPHGRARRLLSAHGRTRASTAHDRVRREEPCWTGRPCGQGHHGRSRSERAARRHGSAVDPGEHTFVFETVGQHHADPYSARGRQGKARTGDARGGPAGRGLRASSNRVVLPYPQRHAAPSAPVPPLEAPSPPAAPPPVVRPAPPAPQPVPTQAERRPAPAPAPEGHSRSGLAVGGQLAITFGARPGVSGAVALWQLASLSTNPACNSNHCAPGSQSDVDNYNMLRTVSMVSFYSGAGLIVAGITLNILAPKGQDAVALSVGPTSAVIRGTF